MNNLPDIERIEINGTDVIPLMVYLKSLVLMEK